MPDEIKSSDDNVVMKIVLNKNQANNQFVHLFDRMCERINPSENASDVEKIAFCHMKISNCFSLLKNNANFENDLADCVIEIMNLSKSKGFKLGEIIVQRSSK